MLNLTLPDIGITLVLHQLLTELYYRTSLPGCVAKVYGVVPRMEPHNPTKIWKIYS